MNIDEMKNNLEHLINRYVSDESQKKILLGSVFGKNMVPVKAIIADLTPYLNGKIDKFDSDILQEVYFHFC